MARSPATVALICAVLVAPPVLNAASPTDAGAAVTTESFKYLDADGRIRFAPSYDEVPERYRSPTNWTDLSFCAEAPSVDSVQQSIQLADVDADGENEFLVFFDDECPNKRQFAFLEVIEPQGDGSYSRVVSVHAERGWRPEILDLDGDGRVELLGRHWGGAPELWVWEDGTFVDLVRGGPCFDAFWSEAMAPPVTPLEETLARVLERYRRDRCQPATP